MRNKFKNNLTELQSENNIKYTRAISPKLCIFSVLGLLGFLGFFEVTFFLGFGFFGFFGFYYEGKMSKTLMDERFIHNRYRAEFIAYKIFSITIIMSSIFLVKIKDMDLLLGALIALIGIMFGFTIFLKEYLLYRFEEED